MSANRMHPLLLLYAKMLQCLGWNSAEVMTCTVDSKMPHVRTEPGWQLQQHHSTGNDTANRKPALLAWIACAAP